MNLQENIRIILWEETKRDLSRHLERLVTKNIVNYNKDIMCGVKVKHPDNRTKSPYQDFEHIHYRIDIMFIDETDLRSSRYSSIIDEVWRLIYDTTRKPVDIFTKKVNNCDEFTGEHK